MTETTLTSTLVGDHWAGIQFTLPTALIDLGAAQFVMVRQASSSSEPRLSWTTSDGTLLLTPKTDGVGTVVTVVGRVLSTEGVWNWRLVSNLDVAPRTWAAGYIIVKVKP